MVTRASSLVKAAGVGGRRVTGLLVVAVVVVLTVGGCSSPEEVPTAAASQDDLFPEGMVRAPTTERYLRCMRDAGWEVTPSWSGGTDSAPMKADQTSAYDAAHEECSESSGWNRANDFSKWSREQIEELYQQEVEAHECFTEIGVESEEPPSLQEFVDRFHTADQYYAMMPWMNNATNIPSVVRQCPPPTWFITVDGF